MASWVYNRMNPYSMDNIIKNYVKPWAMSVLGYNQLKNTEESVNNQISYEQYLRSGNERALEDWHRNVPNRQIRYPELSYPGQIRRADTSIANLGISYDTAYQNYTGNLLYKSMGLYGVPGRLYRSM